MTELKGHQDSKEQGGQPLHFTLSKLNIHVSCLLKSSSGPINDANTLLTYLLKVKGYLVRELLQYHL